MFDKILKYFCPFFWFKKRELSFYTHEPYLHLYNPIIESSKLKRNWVKKAKDTFNQQLLNKNQEQITSFHRCLGFVDICKEGFIIKTDTDFAIETTDNDDEIKIHIEGDTIGVNNYSNPKMFFMKNDLGSSYAKPWGANHNVIKITKTWFIDTPKDVQYLIIPVPYSDDRRFMACSGIQDPMTSRDLTLFFWWFPKNSYEVVEAGTPIVQIIPISKKKIYNSWKMYDFVPEKIIKKHNALTKIRDSTRCPIYSEYKRVADKINISNGE